MVHGFRAAKRIKESLMKLDKHTIGMGDRFAHQGRARFLALGQACECDMPFFPVWNMSNRAMFSFKRFKIPANLRESIKHILVSDYSQARAKNPTARLIFC